MKILTIVAMNTDSTKFSSNMKVVVNVQISMGHIHVPLELQVQVTSKVT